MKKSIYFIVVLIFSNLLGFAQSIECGTSSIPTDTLYMAHYGQNEVLDSVLLETFPAGNSENARSIIGYDSDNFPFHIPVKIWVYSDAGGVNDALPESDVIDLLNGVNAHFAANNSGIQFYLKCTVQNISSTEFNTIDNDDEYFSILDTYYEPRAMNWHLVRSTTTGWSGKARFPWHERKFRFVSRFGGSLSESEILTAVHEIGHTLGLLHTHENTRGSGNYNGDAVNCFQEAVWRGRDQPTGCLFTWGKSKCSINGDALCDTEAAPNKSSDRWIKLKSDGSCDYDGSQGVDHWNTPWDPPTRNYMSYLSDGSCRSDFTENQVGVMHSNAILHMAEGGHWTFPGIGGEPWYNKNTLVLSSSVNDTEIEQIFSPETIHAPATNADYTLNSGSNVRLHGQESITLSPGFNTKQGAIFHATTGPISNCDLVYSGEVTNSNARSLNRISSNIDFDMIDRAGQILLNALQRNNNDAIDSLSELDGIITPKVSAFPNPATDKISFMVVNAEYNSVVLTIYNSTGLVLISKNIIYDSNSGAIEMDLNLLPKGLYFYKLQIGDQTFNGKVLKE